MVECGSFLFGGQARNPLFSERGEAAKCFPFSTFHRVVYRHYVAFVRVRPFSNSYIALKELLPPSLHLACECNHSFGLRSPLHITMPNGLIGARFTCFSSHCCHAFSFQFSLRAFQQPLRSVHASFAFAKQQMLDIDIYLPVNHSL